MKNFAFISRHAPSQSQIALAADQGINLIHVGDADAFTVDACWIVSQPAHQEWVLSQPDDNHQLVGGLHGVVVAHPAAAMRLHGDFAVGVFENANCAEPPSFVAFHVYE